MWPADDVALVEAQRGLAAAEPEPWVPPTNPLVGAAWVCFARGLVGNGAAGDRAWVCAVAWHGSWVVDRTVISAEAGAAYVPGLLALRLGPLLEQALRGLRTTPDVVLVDATGRDHPRGAGLALHLGAELQLPSIGVTHRPLLADGPWPADRPEAVSPLRLRDGVVGAWLRTRPGTRPVVVHSGWRTNVDTAVDVVCATLHGHRTPEPLRIAREGARRARLG